MCRGVATELELRVEVESKMGCDRVEGERCEARRSAVAVAVCSYCTRAQWSSCSHDMERREATRESKSDKHNR